MEHSDKFVPDLLSALIIDTEVDEADAIILFIFKSLNDVDDISFSN